MSTRSPLLRHALLAVGLCASLHGVAALAESAPLTLEQALQLALHRSSAHLAAQRLTQASAEAAAQAGQLPDPMLKLGIDNLPIEGPDRFSLGRDFMTMRRIGIEQPWVSADKRAARSERAGQVVALQQADALMHAVETRAQTSLAWLQMRHAQRALAFAAELARHSGDDAATVQAAHRGGKASAADVALAQLALARAQDNEAKAKQELDAARLALQRWVPLPLASLASVDDALPADLAGAPAADATDMRHPLLVRARRAQALAESELSVARTERSPDWRFELAFSQRGSPYANMLSFGVTIPLTVNPGQRQDRSIAEKAAQAAAAQLQFDEARRAIDAERGALQLNRARLTERAAWLRQHALPMARQAADLAVAAYRGGSGALSAVFSARRMLVEQQLQIAELERDAALAWAQLALTLATEDTALSLNLPETKP
jgi:outer membrane protein TolC